MAVTPNIINHSYARCSATGDGANGLQPRVTCRAHARFDTAVSANPTLNEATNRAMFLTPNSTVVVNWQVMGHTADALGNPSNSATFGVWLYLFQDAVDGGGNGTSNVISQQILAVANRSFPSEGSGGQFQNITSGTTNITIPNSSGTYRAVLVLHSDGVGANPAQNQVDANGEFYWDSDRNGTFQDGGIGQPQAHFDTFAGTIQTSGWLRATSSRSLTFTGAAQKQAGDTFTLSGTGSPGAAHSVKNVRIGTALPASGPTVALIDESSLAMSTGAAVGPTGSINVDTTYASTPTDYRVRMVVGPAGGQSSTPSGEQPNLASIGGATYNYYDTNDRAWIAFTAAANHGLVSGSSFVVQNSTNAMNIASGITLWKDAGFTQSGVGTYNESGYTNANRYFALRQSASLDGPHGRPYLQVYIRDGHGVALNTKSVILQTQDNDGTQENSQTIATDANGRVRWNYQLLDTHKAFNAFAASPSDPDALGANEINIPTADVYKPAGTKTGTYPDPKSPVTTRDFSASQFPGRSKKVKIDVNTTPSGERPTATATNVFGVHSELIFAGMWSGNVTDTAIDANGAPTGTVIRSKDTTAGSYAMKLTGLVDENTFMVNNASDHVPTDRAGRPYDYTGGFKFWGRRAVYNRTDSSAQDTGTALDDVKQALESPLGYTNGTPAVQTFDSLAPPADAKTYGYYQGYASTSGQRDTFGLVAGPTETPRFTGTSGLYGFRLQVIEYSIARNDLKGVLAIEPVNPFPGEVVRLKAKAYQVLPDKTEVVKNWDDAPVVYVKAEGGAGNPVQSVEAITMTPIGAEPTSDYEGIFTPPAFAAGEKNTYVIYGYGKIAGARVPMDSIPVIVGATRNPDLRLAIDFAVLGDGLNHVTDGSNVVVDMFAVNALTKKRKVLDASPAPTVMVFRRNGGSIEYLNASFAWAALGTGEAFAHELTLVGDKYTVDFGVLNNLGSIDIVAVGVAFIDGVRYSDRVFREVVGKKNRHDRYQFNPLKNNQG